MDGQILLGHELTVVFAEENRKKPAEMRARERFRGHSYGRQSPPRYSRSSRYGRSYSRSPGCSYSSRRCHYSRSISPRDRRYREHSYSRSPFGSGNQSRSRSFSRSRSRSLEYSR
ncbi:Serine/arginine-rich SC35-like splicing factor [Quillaja saponaria]|uniref:Serine/arginine-rich SC35-like splicing factor n=1 Tax=Quillaja saponaria TaxID=32244 RepID=A0AAD7VHI0_QUISA|nr:Serine/arginine-rich SC35-like splicing factor [Quillaja saponaria]